MAKRKRGLAKSKNGFQFVFNAESLKSVCEGSTKVVISCYLVTEVTKDDRKVGAMAVWAQRVGGKRPKKCGPTGVPGCPIPPCDQE